MRGGWKSWAQEIPAARMSEKKTATKYGIGVEKRFGTGKLYVAMRGTPS